MLARSLRSAVILPFVFVMHLVAAQASMTSLDLVRPVQEQGLG
jgi:hypothetical protein